MAEVGEPGGPARFGRPSMLLWVLIGVVAVSLVVGAVAGAVRDPLQLDAGSPERVVQDYLQAVLDRDFSTASGFLAESTAERCDTVDFRQAWIPESVTASLDEAQIDGTSAEVRVRLRTVAGPEPFGSGDFSALETFQLVREASDWRIRSDPWPLFDCRNAS